MQNKAIKINFLVNDRLFFPQLIHFRINFFSFHRRTYFISFLIYNLKTYFINNCDNDLFFPCIFFVIAVAIKIIISITMIKFYECFHFFNEYFLMKINFFRSVFPLQQKLPENNTNQ
jgi:hypothetical protein